MTELPLVVVSVQRSGPSTGMPTKTEQADLLQALYGRNGESPVPVLAASRRPTASTPPWRRRIAVVPHPVIMLSDGYLANGAMWKIPNRRDRAHRSGFATGPNGTDEEPAGLPPTSATPRPCAVGGPRHSGSSTARRHREGGPHRQRLLRPDKRPHDAAAPRQDRASRDIRISGGGPVRRAKILVIGWAPATAGHARRAACANRAPNRHDAPAPPTPCRPTCRTLRRYENHRPR